MTVPAPAPKLPKVAVPGLAAFVALLAASAAWYFGGRNVVLAVGVLVVALLLFLGFYLGRVLFRAWSARKRARFEDDLRRGAEAQAVREVEKRFAAALKDLGAHRIDLYGLPWFVVIGEPQSGKSQAILHSGQRFPVGRDKVSGSGGTRNCDFWFTEEAVLLDTAGRFSFHEKNAPDAAEWQAFLALLRAHRPRGPVNGVFVVVPATSLLGDDAEMRREKARRLEDRIGEISRALEIQFPVYLLVTKCDLIPGFAQTFVRVSAAQQREIFGWSKPGSYERGATPEDVRDGLASLRERILAIRRRLLAEEGDVRVADEIFRFPEEFRRIEEPLREYLGEIFRESRYRSPVFLRGIYFTSSLQKGVPIARAFRELLGIAEQGVGEESPLENAFSRSRAFFIEDLFEKKAFLEKGLIQPTGDADRRRRRLEKWVLRVGTGMAAAVALWVAFGFLDVGAHVGGAEGLSRTTDAFVDGTQEASTEDLGHHAGKLSDHFREVLHGNLLSKANPFRMLGVVHQREALGEEVATRSAKLLHKFFFVPGVRARLVHALEAEVPPGRLAAFEPALLEAFALARRAASTPDGWRGGAILEYAALTNEEARDAGATMGLAEARELLERLGEARERISGLELEALLDANESQTAFRGAVDRWGDTWDRLFAELGDPAKAATLDGWEGFAATHGDGPEVGLEWWRALLTADLEARQNLRESGWPTRRVPSSDWNGLLEASRLWRDSIRRGLDAIEKVPASLPPRGVEASAEAALEAVAGARRRLSAVAGDFAAQVHRRADQAAERGKDLLERWKKPFPEESGYLVEFGWSGRPSVKVRADRARRTREGVDAIASWLDAERWWREGDPAYARPTPAWDLGDPWTRNSVEDLADRIGRARATKLLDEKWTASRRAGQAVVESFPVAWLLAPDRTSSPVGGLGDAKPVDLQRWLEELWKEGLVPLSRAADPEALPTRQVGLVAALGRLYGYEDASGTWRDSKIRITANPTAWLRPGEQTPSARFAAWSIRVGNADKGFLIGKTDQAMDAVLALPEEPGELHVVWKQGVGGQPDLSFDDPVGRFGLLRAFAGAPGRDGRAVSAAPIDGDRRRWRVRHQGVVGDRPVVTAFDVELPAPFLESLADPGAASAPTTRPR